MIVGYHIIFGAYGFWLPNDPRGSWSNFVGSNRLYEAAGPATLTATRTSLARNPHDQAQRLAAKRVLSRPSVKFTDIQANVIGHGFAQYFKTSPCPVWACAVMPNHVHLVTGQPPIPINRFVSQLKIAAVRQLNLKKCHPFPNEADVQGTQPRCFVRGHWVVYLEWNDIARTVKYVQNNRKSLGLREQRWSFVRDYPR